MRCLQRTLPLQRLLFVALCLVFLFAQFSAFEHELEHDSHEHEHHASCDAFAAYSASGVACDSGSLHSTLPYKSTVIFDITYRTIVMGTPSFSFIRAPPINASV